MSIRKMTEAWELDIDSNLKLTFLCYCDFSNDEGICWPSKSTVAEKTGFSERTIQNHKNKLIKLGLVEVLSESSGRGNTPQLICLPEKGEKLSPFTQKGENETQKGENENNKGGNSFSPKPSSNRQNSNHQKENGISDEASKLFELWQELDGTITHRSNKTDHRKAIQNRLNDGFEVPEIRVALQRLNSIYQGDVDSWLDTNWTCREFFTRKCGGHLEKMIETPGHFIDGQDDSTILDYDGDEKERNREIKESTNSDSASFMKGGQ